MPRLLVTGASGHLGGEVCDHAVRSGWSVVGTGFTASPSRDVFARGDALAVRLDVRDAAAVGRVVADVRPDAVVHCAYVQDGPQARATVVDGSAHVARAARSVVARLVHLSSDLVFAGEPLGRPLREDDPVAPVLPYGRAKADAEAAVAEHHPDAVVVRTSLVYGGPDADAPRSRHEELVEAAASGARADVSFFSDEVRSPVQAGDLASALLELCGPAAQVAGPLHVAGPDPVSRLRFAELVCGAFGWDAGALRGAACPPGRPRDCSLDVRRATGMLRTRLRGAEEVLDPGTP